MHWWWFSTRRMTVGVATDDDGVIVVSAPIVRKFVGQHVDNLRRWMKKQPGYREQQLADIEERQT